MGAHSKNRKMDSRERTCSFIKNSNVAQHCVDLWAVWFGIYFFTEDFMSNRVEQYPDWRSRLWINKSASENRSPTETWSGIMKNSRIVFFLMISSREFRYFFKYQIWSILYFKPKNNCVEYFTETKTLDEIQVRIVFESIFFSPKRKHSKIIILHIFFLMLDKIDNGECECFIIGYWCYLTEKGDFSLVCCLLYLKFMHLIRKSFELLLTCINIDTNGAQNKIRNNSVKVYTEKCKYLISNRPISLAQRKYIKQLKNHNICIITHKIVYDETYYHKTHCETITAFVFCKQKQHLEINYLSVH